MKTLKISNDVHRKLTYQNAIKAMLNRSVILPTELLAEIENLMEENKHLGYTTRGEFIRDSARWRLKFLKKEYEYAEVPKEKYGRLSEAVKMMNTPYYNAQDFIHKQMEHVLGQFDKWLEEKEYNEKRQRRSCGVLSPNLAKMPSEC
jgi:hypothetical protein